MKVYLEIVCAPTQDHNGSLILLHFDERRYMFGQIAEGTQRLRTESSFKIHRISDVFLTGKMEWCNTGGIVGMLLTMGNIKIERHLAKELVRMEKGLKDEIYGVKAEDGKLVNPFPPPAEPDILTIHGGKNLLNTIATARNFVFRENSGVRFHQYDFVNTTNNIYKDEYINVTPIRSFPRPQEATGASKTGIEEEGHLRDIEDTDLGGREQLENVVEAMWNSQAGSLMVGKDDEDYVSALISRLTEDEERAARLRTSKDQPQSNSSTKVTNRDGESPSKKIKLDSAESIEDDSTWDNILDDAPKTTDEMPTFPQERPLRRPWPATMMRSLPGTIPGGSSLSYIIDIATVRGRFLPEKAKALGVKPGPDFRALASGGSITLPDGTVVDGQQCLEAPRKINGVAFLDIPDDTFLESTIEGIDAWKQERRSKGEHDAIGIWIWALGANVEKNVRLTKYVESLEGRHLLNSPTSRLNDMAYKGSAAQQSRLNLISPENFPLPCPDFDYKNSKTGPLETDGKYFQARQALLLDIHPKEGVSTFKIPPIFEVNAIQDEARGLGDGKYWRSVQKAHNQIKAETSARTPSTSNIDEVEFVTLGTGSALPSKFRNVSSTVVNVPGMGYMILDSGEGSLNQLQRTFGLTEARKVLKNLKILYISHLHADHHLGTISILKAWYLATVKDDQPESNLFLVAPSKYLNFLEEYTQIEDIGFKHVNFVPCEGLLHADQKIDYEIGNEIKAKVDHMMKSLPLEGLETSYAVHCRGSFTVAFTFKEPTGLKIAYSGDTRPTPGFVKIGKGCTVLLHECTFDDELLDEAIKKRHCTTSEAIQAGRDMGAKNILLTHFSQRYPKLPTIRRLDADHTIDDAPLCDPFVEAPEGKETDYSGPTGDTQMGDGNYKRPIVPKPVGEDAMNIAFAFDMMRVKVKDFWKLERYIPALANLFKEEAKLDPTDETEEPISDVASKKQKHFKPKMGNKGQPSNKQPHGKKSPKKKAEFENRSPATGQNRNRQDEKK